MDLHIQGLEQSHDISGTGSLHMSRRAMLIEAPSPNSGIEPENTLASYVHRHDDLMEDGALVKECSHQWTKTDSTTTLKF